ncbi:MAG: hypothetical protein J0H74_08860 [Chitinophagaceae bacterium]|nr:hypothetical protein [Chitinophagaceae bacterium]
MNKKEEPRKKLTKEEKAALLAEAMEAARGKEIFPEAMAEARKFGEMLKKGKIAPGTNW